MKINLLCGLVLGAVPVLGQIPGTSIPAYTTKLGTVFHKGDTLHFAMGKADNGSFRYAYLPQNMFLGTPQKPLTSTWNGLNPVIKDIRQQKTTHGMAPRTVAVIAAPGINACLDLESAESVGEITTRNNQQKVTTAAGAPTTGVADELLKLKKLLDTGAITQVEFDAQKAKLLNR